MERLDLLGAYVAHVIFVLVILVFVARLAGQPQIEYWLGLLLLLTALPLCYLLLKAPLYHRAPLYYLQITLALAYLAVEALLDYVLKLDCRHVRGIMIPYVTLFFAGTGGMIGVAALAGRPWAISSVILVLAMAVPRVGAACQAWFVASQRLCRESPLSPACRRCWPMSRAVP